MQIVFEVTGQYVMSANPINDQRFNIRIIILTSISNAANLWTNEVMYILGQ